jgi:hypothetical protein
VREEVVGDLEQDTGPITGVHLAAARATVVQVLQRREPVVDNLVRLLALQVDDEADTTTVVLVERVVQPLLLRCGCTGVLAIKNRVRLW